MNQLNREVMSKHTGLCVTFWGAARTVTGSMHLVEAAGKKFLLDCGLFQGRRAEAHERNTRFPFEPKRIDAVVLSHAHVDHCGNLPNLVRQGFSGPVYCTPATRDLVAIMLADSAKIQEEDAVYLNKKRDRREPKVEPLYDRRDAHRTVRLCQPVAYERDFDIGRGVQITYVEAGHLLGSAMVAMRVDGTGHEVRLTFTGDLGRRSLPILRDPAPVPACDLLISESTYGGKVHDPVEHLGDALGDVVRRTAERGGKVIIPAFSLGRTQTVVYYLHQLMNANRLPDLPIYVDSPLACQATDVFRRHPECFDEETALLLEDDPDLFGEKRINYIHNVEDSKRLNDREGPCVIIAASGMCEAGRVLHHLKHNIEDECNTVLIIGFQAPETLGRRIVERRPEVRILDRVCKLRAEVVVLNAFSSHADQNDFMAFLGPLAATTGKVRLVHGEPDRAEALAVALRGAGFAEVGVPERGEAVSLE
jgi:metallo-beta-lactamase family protein